MLLRLPPEKEYPLDSIRVRGISTLIKSTNEAESSAP